MKRRGDFRLTTALAYLEGVIAQYHQAMRLLHEGPYETDVLVEDAEMFLRGVTETAVMGADYARKRREKMILVDRVLRNMK